jgi:hypothetical protein
MPRKSEGPQNLSSGGQPIGGRLFAYRSDGSDVFGARPFGATPFFVLDQLSHPEGLDARPLDGGVVEEHVTAFSLDKPKSFVSDQFFDRPLRHNATPSKKK